MSFILDWFFAPLFYVPCTDVSMTLSVGNIGSSAQLRSVSSHVGIDVNHFGSTWPGSQSPLNSVLVEAALAVLAHVYGAVTGTFVKTLISVTRSPRKPLGDTTVQTKQHFNLSLP